MSDFLEKCIRYVEKCAGNGFEDAEVIIREAYKDAGISFEQDEPLETLIEVALS